MTTISSTVFAFCHSAALAGPANPLACLEVPRCHAGKLPDPGHLGAKLLFATLPRRQRRPQKYSHSGLWGQQKIIS